MAPSPVNNPLMGVVPKLPTGFPPLGAHGVSGNNMFVLRCLWFKIELSDVSVLLLFSCLFIAFQAAPTALRSSLVGQIWELEGDLERLHDDLPKLETSLKCCLGSCGAAAYLEPKEEMWSFCNQVVSLDMLVVSSGWSFVSAILGQMTYFVASLTLNSAGSYVMQGAPFTQGMIPSIPIGGRIRLEGLLPSILLLVIQRISLTGFPAQSVGSSNTDVLDLPCLLVLITGMSQSRQHGKSESDSYYLID
ncbi:hypothetical protein Tco_1165423 [Tanacetum coccineum]